MGSVIATDEKYYWYWITERHRIWLRRQAGEPKPWTADPILRDYKFTNPFRQNDRGTVWLTNFLAANSSYIHDVGCAAPNADCNCDTGRNKRCDIAFNICWYRMFNWTGTGDTLGWRTSWDVQEVCRILNERLDKKLQVFTGAHIVYSRPGRGKIEAIVDVCADLFHMCHAGYALETSCREDKSLETIYHALKEVDCVGGFMAYEMVTDMRHTELLNDAHDIMTWANMGPGAQRGLRRLGLPAQNQKQGEESMRQLLARSGGMLPPDIPALEMRDIEHSLCEFDKWARVKHGEGEPRGKFNGR